MTLEGSISSYFSLSSGLLIMDAGYCSAIIDDISETNYFTYSTDADIILSEMQYYRDL